MKAPKTGKAWALLLTFIMAVALLINPMVAKADPVFTDVSTDDWFYPYVMFMAGRNIVGGYAGTTEFRPRNQVTREHASKMIAGAAGLNLEGKTTDFKDNAVINPGLIPYIGALVDEGAINGYTDGTFRPRNNILRSHVCKIVALAFDLEDGDMPYDLTDLPANQELRDAITTLASNGIVGGYSGTTEFRPNNEITRGELSKILCVTMAVSAVQKAEAAMTWEAIWEAQDILDALPYHHIPDTVDDLQGRLNALYEGLTGTEYGFRFRNAHLETAAPYYLVGTSRFNHIRFESGDLYNAQVEVWRGDQQFEILPDPELGNHRYASEWIELEEGYNVFKVVFTDENGETCYRVRIEQELNSDLGFSNMILFGAGYRKVLTPEDFYSGQAECEIFDDQAVLEMDEEFGVDVQAKLNNLPLTASRRRSIDDGRWKMYVWDLIDLQMGVNRLDLTLTSSDGSASQALTVLITRVNPANFVYSQTDIDAVNTLIAANPGWYLDIWESGSEPPSNWSWQVEWAGENPRRLVRFICYDNMDANQADFSSLTALKELNVRGNGENPDSIKLDGLVNLRSLTIGNCLNSMDLAGLVSLQRLTLAATQFESLDLSDQPLLTHLRLDDTGLTSLDLSGQPLLEDLYCRNNQLSQLDLGVKDRLLEVDCTDNKLTALDFGNMPSLLYVYCSGNELVTLNFGDMPSLLSVYCPDNELVTLNFGDMPSLFSVYCPDNELVTLSIGNMPSLLGLACGSNQLTELDLRKAKNLLYLDCQDNELNKIYLHANSVPLYLDVTYNRLAGYSSVIGPSIDWDNPEPGYEYYFAPQK